MDKVQKYNLFNVHLMNLISVAVILVLLFAFIVQFLVIFLNKHLFCDGETERERET
jgi:hypothetical protein